MTPGAIANIRNALTSRPAEIEAARKQGAKVIGWFGYTMPVEIIHALGLIPVRLGTGGDDRLVEIGARYISNQNCVFLRASVGLFAEKDDVYVKNVDAVAIDGTCLQMYRMADLLDYYFKVKTVVLCVPRTFQTTGAREYFHRELLWFVHELEEIAGTPLDPERLAGSVALYSSIRDTIRELYRHVSRGRSSLTWRELYEAVHAGYYLSPEKYASLLHELLARVEHGENTVTASDGPRIMLSGSFLAPGDTKLIEIIEQAGGRVVVDDLWSGLSSSLVRINEPTVTGIADAYMDRVPHAAQPHLDRQTDHRLANLTRLARESNVDGVIYHTLRYCDSFTFKAIEVKEVLGNEGIPMIEIHTEYAGSDTEAIRTRVEAFIELLTNRGCRPGQPVAEVRV